MRNNAETGRLQTPEVFLAVAWMWIKALVFALEVTARVGRNRWWRCWCRPFTGLLLGASSRSGDFGGLFSIIVVGLGRRHAVAA